MYWHRLLALALLGTALPALGVEAPSQDAPPSAVRVRTGLSLREGRSLGAAGGFGYQGASAGNLGLGVRVGLGERLVTRLDVDREAFAVDVDGSQLSRGSLLRGQLLLGAVFTTHGFWMEPHVGYGYAELPVLGTPAAPAFDGAKRHALLLSGRAGRRIAGPLSAELGLVVPVTLAGRMPDGTAFKSSGVGAELLVLVQLARLGSVELGGTAGYTLLTERYKAGSAPASTQHVSKLGVGLELAWGGGALPRAAPLARAPAPASDEEEPLAAVSAPPEPKRPESVTGTGGLLVRVVDADTGEPVPAAVVDLQQGETLLKGLSQSADGILRIDSMPRGTVVARARAEGYLPGEARGAVEGDGLDELSLTLRRAPPKKAPRKYGELNLVVLDARTRRPIPSAHLVVKGDDYFAGKDGDLQLVELPAGTIEVVARADGFKGVKQMLKVVPGEAVTATIELQRAPRR